MSTKKKLSYDAVVAEEQDLLDQLEASTSLINKNVRLMQQESVDQNKLIGKVQKDSIQTKAQLYTETENIHYTRTLKEDYCWMYLVITAEIFIIFFLLWIGFR